MLVVASYRHMRKNTVGGKKGNRTEPNRTTGLYRAEPTEISDTCGTGFYRRHPNLTIWRNF